MHWSSLRSPEGPAGLVGPASSAEHAEMLRRFVEASRRAEIVTLVNSSRTQAALGDAVTGELCEAFEAEVAFVVAEPRAGAPPELVGSTGLVGDQHEALLHDPLVIGSLADATAQRHEGADLLGSRIRRLAIEPFQSASGGRGAIAVGRMYDQAFDPAEIALLDAVTRSTAYALDRFWLDRDRGRHAGRQAALVRSARTLNASLNRDEVLETLCREVAGALGADIVNVYFGNATDGLVAVAAHGLGPDFVGFRRAPGEGLCGQAVRTGRPQISNAYRAEGYAPESTAQLGGIHSALSVPLQRYETVDGALSIAFSSERWIDENDVETAQAFAELASVACRNAEVHADARRAAMVDSLTGCLNHGAFQTLLREAIAHAERRTPGESDADLCLALLDLRDFKSVNEEHGHPAGDALLRMVGDLLRGAVRPYDQVARYGGDEFAILLTETTAEGARAAVDRARTALATATRPDGRPLSSSGGFVEWQPGEQAADLLDRVDRGLRDSKQGIVTGAAVPDPGPGAPEHPARRERAGRRVQRLAVAGRIGGRLARLLDVAEIAETAVTEINAALAADFCRLVRLHDDGYVSAVATAGAADDQPGWTQPQDQGAIGRCLRERRSALVAGRELAVPVVSGSSLWGALHIRSEVRSALGGEDADFVEIVCDHLGAALHTADLYRRLDQAYLGTAEALAAALEAKDDYTADHARSIADLAVAVGDELDLDQGALRDLRYGAVFHDIGKIAIPDAILNKNGPLTDAEFDVIKTHPLAGEQILAPVPFLSSVRRIVRHDHERWDGTGYPDGLRGPQIPIGARIVFVVDAFHAMVSDRPYRRAMPLREAREELRRAAGTQFDPAVVTAFLKVLDESAHPLG